MPEWLVRLTGKERDLRFLATTRRAPDCEVTEEDGKFHLRSSRLETLTDAGQVKTEADEMMERANLVAPARFEGYRDVLPGEVVRLGPDGSRDVTVFLEAGAVLMAATATAFRSVTVMGSHSKPESFDLTRDMSLLGRQPALRVALSYIRDEPNWHGYYKAYEAIRDAVGGDRGLIKKGWSTKKALSRFTHSAQPERHLGSPEPADRMTAAEGRSVCPLPLETVA